MTESQEFYLAVFMMDNKISEAEAEYIKLIHKTIRPWPERIKLPCNREIEVNWSSAFI